MINQLTGTVKLPGKQGWDTKIPFPFRNLEYGQLCVAAVSLKGDVVAVVSTEGEQNVELYPTELIEVLSEPIPHIVAN